MDNCLEKLINFEIERFNKMVYEEYWIPGTFTIIGFIISVLIAPHINWGIEKKKNTTRK